MGQDFRCQRCELRFTLGVCAYRLGDGGYLGIRFMVCTSCGTQHGFEIASRDRGPEFHEIWKVVVEQVPSPVPQVLVKWIRRNNGRVSLAQTFAFAQRPPFVLDERTRKEQAARICDELAGGNVIARAEYLGLERNPNFGPLHEHRLIAMNGPTEIHRVASPLQRMQAHERTHDHADPDARTLSCLHCDAEGTLTTELSLGENFVFESETTPCPRCKAFEMSLERGWLD